MEIGKVVGNVWATKKDEGVNGQKLLIVQMEQSKSDRQQKGLTEGCVVAVDRIGAGAGDLVLVTFGSPARAACLNSNAPIDAAIIGIIDSLDIHKI